MPIHQLGETLLVYRLSLLPAEVPILLEQHRARYPGGSKIEQEGKTLKANGFPEAASIRFVEDVHNWSMMRRNAERVRKAGGSEIAAKLQAASQQIDDGDEPQAIRTLCQLPHLGISYASKIARFLDPEKCVILDSVIRERLGYPNHAGGYVAFLQDCRDTLEVLKASPLLDSRCRADLRICDVEAALFMKAKE